MSWKRSESWSVATRGRFMVLFLDLMTESRHAYRTLRRFPAPILIMTPKCLLLYNFQIAHLLTRNPQEGID